ncbi:ZIP family metal transporter [Azospirillum sp. ST 5-10]|uniref:ZIP family metal transporter n=1 Tax=unclassified Azospirillum TaxID=2630922 RepID=UPI003F4A22BA
MEWSTVWMGLAGSAAAGAATGLGALPVLVIRDLSQRLQDTLLGFAAGVMLAASFFSLIVPGLDAAREQGFGGSAAAGIVIAAILMGALALGLINRYAPHEHFVSGPNGHATARVRRIWLFVVAITLHNFPEGLAVGVGYGGGEQEGHALALAIGLQNMPEGLAVATSLASLGYGRLVAVGLALATGLVEPFGGLLGAGVVSVSQPLLPWGLGFAAGAMLFVISNEIIPETHRKGHESLATSGLMVGLALMMFLDVSLG